MMNRFFVCHIVRRRHTKLLDFRYTIINSHWTLSRHTFEFDLILLWWRLKHNTKLFILSARLTLFVLYLRCPKQMRIKLFVNASKCMR